MRTSIATGIFAWATGAAIFIASDDKKAPPPVPTASEVKVGEPSLAGDFPVQEAKKVVADGRANAKVRLNDEIESALEHPSFADFAETPLSNALQFLATDRNIRIYIDQSGLADAMVDKDQAITLQMQGVRLALILDLMLEPLNLDYAVRENVLFISSKDRIRKLQEIAVMRLGDILPPGEDAAEAAERFVKLITDNIDHDDWTENGGFANIQYMPDARSLVVTAGGRTQRKITKLLSELRSAKVAQGVPANSQGTAKIAAR